MQLTREEAIRLFHEMWSDMQKDLGDSPSSEQRKVYKKNWCEERGYEKIDSNCFLCEYTHFDCDYCPID